ncbi:MAG: 3-dehydroquinate synthase [Candidatus Solincola sediminis]|uniref:3-dehydroquinate synthase n=1 Tax=Candidatus Solincola sediminis TaxID=1797199 RepID=A0A1F2WFQ4_9ACTN|nr:MAG: 3-dehydroquinate synthase [Candidatus Solincola sediminis]
MEKIQVNIPGKEYWVYVGGDAYATKLGQSISRLKPGKTILISHPGIMEIHGRRLLEILHQEIEENIIFLFPEGERHKNLEVLESGYRFLFNHQANRDDVVLAFGGGVVGDMAGFLAASFMRGIRYIQLPTTLMAMVDSSIGGKVGIDLPFAKNAVGSFYQPEVVLTEPSLLATLPPREIRSGMAEVAKYGFLYDLNLLKELQDLPHEFETETPVFTGIVTRCIEYKARVVSEDERDVIGKRAELNYGHTFGHALESATGYKLLRHGEAVAMGMMIAARISELASIAATDLVGLHRKVLLPLLEGVNIPEDISMEMVESALESDKKRGQKWNFILLESPQKVRMMSSLPKRVLAEAIAETIADVRMCVK